MINDIIRFESITYRFPDSEDLIFDDFSLKLPRGVVSLVGQNGTGKSTLLLLAAGLLLPVKGKVYLFDIDTYDLGSNTDRQKYVSFIHQNMEFETQDKIGNLLSYVYDNGFYEEKRNNFIPELIKTFDLKKILNKKTQGLSKGELQRTILAFSLLYGSRIIMMDEPIFAMEEFQKEEALEFLKKFSTDNNISIYYSLHDLELSKKYSDFTLLFYKDKPPLLGPTCMIHEKENIEDAFQVPYSMLKRKEKMFRDFLINSNTRIK